MLDIITFGSATSDVFLKLKKDSPFLVKGNNFEFTKEICFPLGSKISVQGLKTYSGGGGTNTVCSFANLGLKTAYMGKVGNDSAGALVIHDLKKFLQKSFKLATPLLQRDENQNTASSVILSTASGERTVLVRRGACHFLKSEEIPWRKIKKTKWFYLAPLSGQSAKVFSRLVDFAKERKIKVAANLGNSQLLNLKRKELLATVGKLDALLLNLEEASLLTGVSYGNEMAMLRKISSFCKGIIVITKGKDGVVVLQGRDLWHAQAGRAKAVEKTGAGDAFNSGFVAGLIKKNSIEYAIQLASANAASCISQVGAKNGLIGKEDLRNLPKVKIQKIDL